MTTAQSTKKFILNNGVQMPGVGMGTFRIQNEETIMNVVDYALEAGYRMFDTALVYRNEHYIGAAFRKLLPKYGLKREDIFVTTKMPPSNHGGDEITRQAFNKSLSNLGLDYVDLYLIHFPGAQGISTTDPRNDNLRKKTWKTFTEIYKEGKAKAIGLSNYTVYHLKELMSSNNGVVPAVNQVEWHPYYFQPELLAYCKENNIVLQAYCSLGGTSAHNDNLLHEPTVTSVAKKLNVSKTQLLLCWALQQDVAVIPKSTNKYHIKQNIELDFLIPQEDIDALNGLGKHNIKYAWDPSNVV